MALLVPSTMREASKTPCTVRLAGRFYERADGADSTLLNGWSADALGQIEDMLLNLRHKVEEAKNLDPAGADDVLPADDGRLVGNFAREEPATSLDCLVRRLGSAWWTDGLGDQEQRVLWVQEGWGPSGRRSQRIRAADTLALETQLGPKAATAVWATKPAGASGNVQYVRMAHFSSPGQPNAPDDSFPRLGPSCHGSRESRWHLGTCRGTRRTCPVVDGWHASALAVNMVADAARSA